MATTTNLDSLVINYLTQEQYDEAQQAGTLNANQLYLTPDTGNTYGTVTSIGIANATNGGLSISGSPVTSSGSITVGHSNVLSSAQTTQAVYPIKIDKNGHISAYGSAITIPTKTSDLTNDSSFVTTDEKVKATALTFDDNEYYPIFGDSSGIAKTKNYTTAFGIGCSSTYNRIDLKLGTASIAGQITLYRGQDSNRYATIKINTITGGRIITIPDKTGTIALTSDIPSVYSSTNTGGYLTMATLPIYNGTVV